MVSFHGHVAGRFGRRCSRFSEDHRDPAVVVLLFRPRRWTTVFVKVLGHLEVEVVRSGNWTGSCDLVPKASSVLRMGRESPGFYPPGRVGGVRLEHKLGGVRVRLGRLTGGPTPPDRNQLFIYVHRTRTTGWRTLTCPDLGQRGPLVGERATLLNPWPAGHMRPVMLVFVAPPPHDQLIQSDS